MLIGRQDEQRTLDALLAGARVGRSGVLVLSGDAGIGKSALLAHARESAAGLRLLQGVGTAAEHDLPFAGLAGVLQPLLAGLDDLPAPQAQALGVALALREGDAVDRFAVSAAALTLTTRAAESGPLGLVVDDAHLLDTPSAQALAFVARRLLVDAVFLLAAVRPGVTDVWNGLPTLDLLPLGPVAADELAVLAARDVLTPEQRRRIAADERRQPARDPGTRPKSPTGSAPPRPVSPRPCPAWSPRRSPDERRGSRSTRSGCSRSRSSRPATCPPSPPSAPPRACPSTCSVAPRRSASWPSRRTASS